MHAIINVRALVTVDDYIAERKSVFPSRESWRWFERAHREELIKAGALSAPTGKKLIDPTLADQLVAQVGHRRAIHLAGA